MSAQIKKAGAGRAPALAGIRNRRWKGAGMPRIKSRRWKGAGAGRIRNRRWKGAGMPRIKSRRWKGAGWAQGIFPAALGGERIAR
jgi:hypothetical protein